MFTYELQQARQHELYREAEQWRLARDAKAARTAERRARRSGARAAVRTDAEGAAAAGRGTAAGPVAGSVTGESPVAGGAGHRAHGRVHRAPHPHSAA